MIKLKSVKGHSELELSVLGYESPDNPHCNWYMVRALVSKKNETFETVFPALETTDLPHLVQWFENLFHLKLPSARRKYFTEPCIEFEYLSWQEGAVWISVTLHQEMKPLFSSNDCKGDNWSLISKLSSKDFSSIIKNMKLIMEKYPIRGNAKKRIDVMQAQAEQESLYRKLVEFNPDEIEQILAEGELKGRRKVALNMRQDGMPVETICKYTGLTVREICRLKA